MSEYRKPFLALVVCAVIIVCNLPLGVVAQTIKPKPGGPPRLTSAQIIRLLEQATFGPNFVSFAQMRSFEADAWFNDQFNAPISTYPNLTPFDPDSSVGCPSGSPPNCFRDNYTMYPLQVQFFKNAVQNPDQLRQRLAFALGQIWVVSGVTVFQPSSMSPFLNILNNGAFGNFRQLMQDITLNPAMGQYLDMVNNDKRSNGRPNENYARELLQLFTIGLHMLNQDGTPQLDGQGNPIPTYDQNAVIDFSRALTGWTYAPKPGVPDQSHNPEYYLLPMVAHQTNHDTNPKTLLNGQILPSGQTALKDLTDALDNIFNHPNVAPFICKQLIQHLVTSNPTPAYVGRVSAVFNNNGTGVRGDLRAVVKAILLDTEAFRETVDAAQSPNYGHLREPVLYITSILRAFNATTDGTLLAEQGRNMGQYLFNSPSVFNYYRPNYQVPGTGILGPEFSIQTTSAAIAHANFANTMVFSRINNPDTGQPGTVLDISPYQQLATLDTSGQLLVDELNQMLLHGTMSSAMRTRILQAVTSVPTSNPQRRAQWAIYLVITSTQYSIER
jgi:uncharacterized protein (DUF1800 family)